MTCATCRWWTRDSDRDIPREVLLDEQHNYWKVPEDEVDQARDLVRLCGSPKLLFYTHPQDGEAAVIDGSDYKGNLCTTPSFGCTSHEPLTSTEGSTTLPSSPTGT